MSTMVLYYWDLIVEGHAAIIEPQADSEAVLVRSAAIDFGAGEDVNFRDFAFSSRCFQSASNEVSLSAALKRIEEGVTPPNPPMTCEVSSVDEAKDAILAALHARGRIDVNCDGMRPDVFRFVRKVVESLEGDPMRASYTLKLFNEPKDASAPTSQTLSSAPQPVATPGLADW